MSTSSTTIQEASNPRHFVYMSIVDILRTQSNCLGSKFGCVIVNPHTNGSMYIGYNGGPTLDFDSKDCGCPRCIKRSQGLIKSGEKLDECICIHAETRALLWVPTDYKNTHLLDLYVQGLPCLDCTHQIINTGYIANIYIYDDYYTDKEKTNQVKELFRQNNIAIHYVNHSQVMNFKWEASKH